MVLEVFNRSGNLISVHRTRKALSEAFAKTNISGFSKNTLKKNLIGTNSFTKGGLTIRESKNVKAEKLSKKAFDVDIDIKPIARKNKQVISVEFDVFSPYNQSGSLARDVSAVVLYVQEALSKNKVNPQRKVFQISMELQYPTGRIQWVGTPFVSYNELFDAYKKLHRRIYTSYNDSPVVLNLTISFYKKSNLSKQLVLKSLNQEMLRDYYEDMMKDDDTSLKLMEFRDIWNIGCVNTTVNCFSKAVYHAYLKTTDSKLVSEKLNLFYKRMKHYSSELREVERMGLTFSGYLKIKINIYNEQLDLELTYGEEFEETINILVIHCHAFYLLPNDKKIDRKLFQKSFIEQKLIQPTFYKQDYAVVFGTLDFETYNDNGETLPFALGYKVKKYNSFFGDDVIESFISDLSKLKFDQKTRIIMYAHNGGKFDNLMILQNCVKNGRSIMNPIRSEGRLISFTINLFKGHSVQFRDSICLLNGKLDNLLDDFDTKARKLDMDHSIVNKDNYKTSKIKNMYDQYLKNDVEGLLEVIKKTKGIMKKQYNLDLSTCVTASSFAKKYVMKNLNFKKYPVYSVSSNIEQRLREHFIGGRCESFLKGVHKGKFYYYDFTSMYAWVMQNYEYGYDRYKIKKPVYQNKFNRNWFGLVRCQVRSINKDKLPLFGKRDIKTTFEHLDEWTELYLSTEEIKYAIDNDLGYEYKFLEVYHYDKKDNYFKRVAEKIYKNKIQAEQNNNQSERKLAKTILCSIFGFWGTNTTREVMEIKEFPNLLKREFEHEKQLTTGKMMEFEDIKEDEDGKITSIIRRNQRINTPSNIIIAMMTTSYARLELYKLMKNINDQGGKIYYADTDSIITDICIEDNKTLSDLYKTGIKGDQLELGDLTNESGNRSGHFNRLVVLDQKRYCLKSTDNNILKFAGVNVNETYTNKKIDNKNKKIIYTGINKEGTKKMSVKDYELVSKGYSLQVDSFNFESDISDLKNEQSILRYVERSKTF